MSNTSNLLMNVCMIKSYVSVCGTSDGGENIVGEESIQQERESAILESASKGLSTSPDNVERSGKVLESGKGSSVLEGSSAVTEREYDPSAGEGGEDAAAGIEPLAGGKEGGTQGNCLKEDVEDVGGTVEGDREGKEKKRKYVLRGRSSALAVQLFGMDEKFEMR